MTWWPFHKKPVTIPPVGRDIKVAAMAQKRTARKAVDAQKVTGDAMDELLNTLIKRKEENDG